MAALYMLFAVPQDDEEEMQEILIPEYVDIGDEFDINDYYAIGDSVSALILDGGLEEGRVALTHFTDADVQTDAIQVRLSVTPRETRMPSADGIG